MDDLLLTIDTSTRAGSLALTRGEEVLEEFFARHPGTHSDWLLPELQKVLERRSCRVDDLAAIAVVVGPGSFTGLRVGLATAKGLAMAAALPMVGVSSLATVAAALPPGSVPVCALLDARKQEVYAGLFDVRGDVPVPLAEECVLPPERLAGSLPDPVCLVGDGALVYRDLLAGSGGAGLTFAPDALAPPRAVVAARLARERLKRGETLAPAGILPRYIRPSEAEIAWRDKAL